MTLLLAATFPPVLRHRPLLVHTTVFSAAAFCGAPSPAPSPAPATLPPHPPLSPELFNTHEWSLTLIAPAIFSRTRIGAWLAYRRGKRRRRRGRVTSRPFIRYHSDDSTLLYLSAWNGKLKLRKAKACIPRCPASLSLHRESAIQSDSYVCVCVCLPLASHLCKH